MMGAGAQGPLLYGVRLDDHATADHLLRRIGGLPDFDFVHEALAARDSTRGPPFPVQTRYVP